MSVVRLLNDLYRVARTHSSDACTDAPLARYCAALEEEPRGPLTALSSREWVARLADHPVVLAGDHHGSRRVHRGLLEVAATLALATGGRMRVFLECVELRHQPLLCRFREGSLDETALASALAHDENWSFSFEIVRSLLRLCRTAGIDLVALEAGAADPAARDASMAGRLSRSLQRHPRDLHFVVVGESHLSIDHLPRQLRSVSPRTRVARVLVNSARDFEAAIGLSARRRCPFFACDEDCFVLFNGSPIEKAWWSTEPDPELAVERTVLLARGLAQTFELPCPDPEGTHWFVDSPGIMKSFLEARNPTARANLRRRKSPLVALRPLTVEIATDDIEQMGAAAALWLSRPRPARSIRSDLIGELGRFLISPGLWFRAIEPCDVDRRRCNEDRLRVRRRFLDSLADSQPFSVWRRWLNPRRS